MNLGIETKGLSDQRIEALEKSVASAIKVNERNAEIDRAFARQSFDIQRRGQRLPGDVGNNFGLFADDLHGRQGFLGPFANTYPGSYFFSGMFGGGGYGSNYGGGFGLGAGGYGIYSAYGQGSYAAFKRNTKLAHYKMGLCVSAYKGFGLAKNVIDLMANFASEGLKIRHKSKTVERFLQRWAWHVDLAGRVKDMLRYYYKYGNVFVYRTLGKIDQQTYLKMRRSRANVNENSKIPNFNPILSSQSQDLDPVSDQQQTERLQDAKSTKKIPWRYTLLNPFQMELRGSKFFGGQRWVFILDHNTVNEIRRGKYRQRYIYTDFLDESDVNLPAEFLNKSKKISSDARDEEYNDPRIVDLEQEKLYTMHYMKDDHEDWAEPLLWPVMADIFYKNKLRQMDMSVCNSVINAVTIYKLGNLKEGYIPPEEHFDKFSEFLRTPSQAMQMVWNDAISIESSYPPVERILGMQKYESVDRDILRGIGIPDTLIGGQVKSNFSTGFLGVRTLLERLEEGRQTVERWLTKELEVLCEALGIRKMPTVKFGKMSLRDEQKEKQLILQLLDRNIISIEAVLETFGEDFEIELQRMKEESEIREDTGLLKKHSPYPDPISDMDSEEKIYIESKMKQQEKRITERLKSKEKKNAGKNGRPPGTDGIPQNVQRETKPQGMAWLLDYENVKNETVKQVDKIEKVVAKEVLKATGKKTKRSLTKEQAQAIEDITFAVTSKVPLGSKVTSEVVLGILENDSVIAGDVYNTYQDMRQEGMTLKDRKIAMASAIAFCRLKGE